MTAMQTNVREQFSRAATLPGYDVYSLLKKTMDETNVLEQAPNKPLPFLELTVRQATKAVETTNTKDDLFLNALKVQTLNHLKHISFRFNIENEDYPHDLPLKDAFAAAPTCKALQKAFDFLDIAYGARNNNIDIKPVVNRSEEEIKASQDGIIRSILNNPLAYYQQARERLEKGGPATSFPEFKDNVDFLLFKMEKDPEITQMLAKNPQMRALAAITHDALTKVSEEKPPYPYQKTLDSIERGLEFFDVANRGLHPDKAPPLYHSNRYEYYLHYLSAQAPAHVLFPTIAGFSAEDLLSVRGVPIGFAGVNTGTLYVDGFYQTPYEFYIHDINHSRRMEQFAREEVARRGIDDMEFYTQTNKYVRDVLIPQIHINETDGAAEATKKKIKKMILFEILHEDAMPADPDVIRDSFLRKPEQLTPFEKINDDKTVSYIMEPGATTLAYVFRKLAHTFYDTPDNRSEAFISISARKRAAIAKAAKELYSQIGLGKTPVRAIDAYVATDAGFPDDFRRTLEEDIKKRGLKKLETEQSAKKPRKAKLKSNGPHKKDA